LKTLAAVLQEMGRPAPYARSQPLAIRSVDLDAPGPGELLVRVLAAGLCHSDLSVIDGSRPRPLPMVLGHEAVGEVLALGAHTEGFAAGDRVVLSFVPSCGHCPPCASGRPALCEPGAQANAAGTLLSGACRWHADGIALHHHLGVSAFAQTTVVCARSAVKIDRDLPPEIAALFGCAVLTGVGAVVNTARLCAGESLAVFGLGGVGLAALLAGLTAGAHPIVAVDVQPAKLELARALGATHAVLAGADDCLAQIKAATAGGAHYALETVGSEVALAQAYAATRRGGVTVSVGLPHPQKMFSVPAVSLVAEERTVKGSYLGSAVPARDIPRYLALYRAGRLPVDRLISHRLRLDELNVGFDRLAQGAALRQIVLFD
jgi:Zn-dependent alcohol dehydrogenase